MQPQTYITGLPAISAGNIDRTTDLIEIVDVSGNQSVSATPNAFLNVSSQVVATTDTQTLTNKTLTSPVISSPVFSGTITGTYTIGGTPTFPAAVVTLTGSQTLTNKTLTGPTINTATIVNPTITADSISGFTTPNSGTIYGASIVGGVIASAALSNSVNTAAIQTGAVGGSNLSTTAITIGYAQMTVGFSTTSAIPVQVTGLSSTVTIPSGGRRLKITAYSRGLINTSVAYAFLTLWDGAVQTGTKICEFQAYSPAGSQGSGGTVIAVLSPSAGAKTYNVGLHQAGGGTASVQADPTFPAFILVEMI